MTGTARKVPRTFGRVAASLLVIIVAGCGDDRQSSEIVVRTIAERGVGDGEMASAVPIGRVLDITSDREGNVYYVDDTYLRVRRVRTDGLIDTVFDALTVDAPGRYSFPGPHSFPRAVVVDSDKHRIYIADSCVIWVVENERPPAIFAGTGECGFSGDGGPARRGTFSLPEDLSLGDDGTLYVADRGTNRIRAIDPDGTLHTVAGDLPPGADIRPDTLYEPNQVEWTPDGSLYVADRNNLWHIRNGAIERVTSGIYEIAALQSGTLVADVGRRLSELIDGSWFAFGDDQMTGARPIGTIGARGDEILGYNRFDNRIYLIPREGSVEVIAGNGTHNQFGEGRPASEAVFYCSDLMPTGDGGIIFADYFVQRVAAIDRDGILRTVAGRNSQGPSFTPLINTPLGIAMGHSGEFYIADPGSRRVLRLDPDGTVTTFAGNGAGDGDFAVSSGDNGPAIDASFGRSSPNDVAVGPSGDVFISDQDSNHIRKVDSSGTISTFAAVAGELQVMSNGNVLVNDNAQIVAVSMDGQTHPIISVDELRIDDGYFERIDSFAVDGDRLLMIAGARLFKARISEMRLEPGSLRRLLPPKPLRALETVQAMAVDASGRLLVCDPRHGRILQLQVDDLD